MFSLCLALCLALMELIASKSARVLQVSRRSALQWIDHSRDLPVDVGQRGEVAFERLWALWAPPTRRLCGKLLKLRCG